MANLDRHVCVFTFKNIAVAGLVASMEVDSMDTVISVNPRDKDSIWIRKADDINGNGAVIDLLGNYHISKETAEIPMRVIPAPLKLSILATDPNFDWTKIFEAPLNADVLKKYFNIPSENPGNGIFFNVLITGVELDPLPFFNDLVMTVAIYDNIGNVVYTLKKQKSLSDMNSPVKPQDYSFYWDGKNKQNKAVAGGTYAAAIVVSSISGKNEILRTNVGQMLFVGLKNK